MSLTIDQRCRVRSGSAGSGSRSRRCGAGTSASSQLAITTVLPCSPPGAECAHLVQAAARLQRHDRDNELHSSHSQLT